MNKKITKVDMILLPLAILFVAIVFGFWIAVGLVILHWIF